MDNDALDRLGNRIETKAGSEPLQRRGLGQPAPQAPRGWEPEKRSRSRFAWMNSLTPIEILFALSMLFFIGATTVAALMFVSGDNTVSTKNVGISISGPTTVRAGDIVTLQVVITNKNTVPMNLTDMVVEFPPGTRSDTDVTVDLPRVRQSLGTIEPGTSVNRTLKAVMFGARGAPVDVKVSAEYRVPSSNAVFNTESIYHATISQSPASVSVDALKEVVSGEQTDIVVHVASNASEDLSGMLLVATYPPGFTFISATPAPVSGSAVWDLGTISPRDEKIVTIRGTFTGEDQDDRVVHFTTGTKKKVDDTAIAAPLATSDVALIVTKPFVSVQLALNGDTTGERSAERGEVVRGEVRWTNNLPVRVQDVEIEVKLNGAILNKSTVKSEQGFFRSSDTTLLFNKQTDARLADVDPGVSNVSAFQFAALPPSQGTFKSPQINLTATVRAKRTTEGAVPEVITSSDKASLVITTDLAVTSSLAFVGGPRPPQVDQETTYAVTWSVNNSANALADTVVSAILPPYVSWKGSPSTPDISYNPNGRTITWTIGDISAGESRSGTFQIAIVPSLPQVRSSPALLSNLRISAFDRFVRSALERAGSEVTTQTSTTLQLGTVVP